MKKFPFNYISLRSLVVCCCLFCAVWFVEWLYVNDLSFDKYSHQSQYILKPNSSMLTENGFLFLKTHKTAGSTLSRVFFRVLCSYKKRICFQPPISNPGRTWNLNNKNDWNYIISQSHSIGKPFQVWINHAVNTPHLFDIIPQARVMISIVRKPSSRFHSAWYWYEIERKVGISLPEFIEKYRRMMNRVPRQLVSPTINLLNKFHYRTGLDATTTELLGITTNYQFWLSSIFNRKFSALSVNIKMGKMLLLVADRFDESLVILASLYNWPLHYLFYINQKVNKLLHTHVLTTDEANVLDLLQPYDKCLYDIANDVLNEYIDDYGGGRIRFQQKLAVFQSGLHKIQGFCSELCYQYDPTNGICEIRQHHLKSRYDYSVETGIDYNTSYANNSTSIMKKIMPSDETIIELLIKYTAVNTTQQELLELFIQKNCQTCHLHRLAVAACQSLIIDNRENIEIQETGLGDKNIGSYERFVLDFFELFM